MPRTFREMPSANAASIWARRSPASRTRRTAVTEATFMLLPTITPAMGIT